MVPGQSLQEIVAAIRAELGREPGRWREIVDSLRPVTNDLWGALSIQERLSFESELRSWWDIHRHRLAPRTAARLDELTAAGRVVIRSGTVLSVGPHPEGRLLVQLAGGELLSADAVVNATGPARAGSEGASPLVRRLLRCGRASLEELGAGLATTADGALIDIEGVASRRCFAIGPLRRGQLFESTAMPEIRVQAAALAGVLTRGVLPAGSPAPDHPAHVNSTNPIGY